MEGGFCPDCGAASEPGRVCEQCGYGTADRGDRDGSPIEAIIPYRNIAGLLGYYCGVFGLIPCLGLLLAPAALILGVVGLHSAKRRPEIRGRVHCYVAIGLGLLALVANIIGIVLLVASGGRRW